MGKYRVFFTVISSCFLIFNFHLLKSQTPSDIGEWSDVIPFEIVPVAVANLPDGRLINWSSQFPNTFVSSGSGFTYTQIFNPLTNSTENATVSQTDHDMFCPGINNLPDGRILSAGGTTSQRTSIYDPVTGIWSAADDMNVPRGYQGNVTLSDGSVFTVGGSWDATPDGGKNAELWTPETGWVYLPGIVSNDLLFNSNDSSLEPQGIFRLDNHVWLWPAPNGKLFQAGPGEIMHWIDVEGNNGAGSVISAGQRADDTYSMKGTTVMFDKGKILKVGGSASYSSGTPASEKSYVIDIDNVPFGVYPSVDPTANSLSFARTMHNSVVLPNGEVLVTGGLDQAMVFTDTGAALTAELYNPTTNSWRNVAGMITPRTYHSVSILMLDGRVFVGGGGLCDSTPGCENHTNAEIYSPPYLFDSAGELAERPEILASPESAEYHTNITVSTDVDITEFSLIRFSSATHSTNNEQRRIPLEFSGSGDYQVTILGREYLPPGYYMLFALDANGVPSVAKAIKIGDAIPLSVNPSLLLDFSFDNTTNSSTNLAIDNSQYQNLGTVIDVDANRTTKTVNSSSWGTGLFGDALETDGFEFQSNTILDVPYSESLGRANRFITIMAWVKRDDIINNASVLSHDYPKLFFGFHNSLFKWEFRTTNGIGSCYAGYSPQSEWVHIAATYDGNTARLFANGVEVCSDIISGEIAFNTTENDFSAFTVSGFYERRAQPSVDYNGSGVTDELDGKIDELKLFNKAMSPKEIKSFYESGAQLPQVADCSETSIIAEFKIGIDGQWVQGTNINAFEGDQVFIRAKDFNGQYFLSTPVINGITHESTVDFSLENGYQVDTHTNSGDNNGLVIPEDSGRYVLTTNKGCIGVIDLKVAGVCGPNDIAIIPEYKIDGVWSSGLGDLEVKEGTELILSLLPNDLRASITLPDGSIVKDNFDMGKVTSLQSGAYLISAENGCSEILNLIISDFNCDTSSFVPEYKLNGVWHNGDEQLTVDSGANLVFSVFPNDHDLTITLPNGSKVGDNFELDSVTPEHSGTYLLAINEGCHKAFELVVLGEECTDVDVSPTYSIDKQLFSGEESITVNQGQELELGILNPDLDYTITLPNDTEVSGSHLIEAVLPSDSGTYLFSTKNGCFTTLEVEIIGSNNCDTDEFTPEYKLNGVWLIGEDELIVDSGDNLVFSILPNNLELTITLPNGVEVGDNYRMDSVTTENYGTYLLTANGCQKTFKLVVLDEECTTVDLIPKYSIDKQLFSGEESITVIQGQELELGVLNEDADVTITLPNDTEVSGSHLIESVLPSDSGTYIFTSVVGCVTTLELEVVSIDNCDSNELIPEYRLNNVWGSGSNELIVEEGTEVVLSMLPNTMGLTITLPNGSEVNDNFNLGFVTSNHDGTYLLTSESGCRTTIKLNVPSENCVNQLDSEYTIDGVVDSGSNSIELTEGQDLTLGITQENVTFTILLPNGSHVNGDHQMLNVVPSQSGTYTFTSEDGCSETLDILITTVACQLGDIVPEYTIDGVVDSGSNSIELTEGQDLTLGITQENVMFTILLPNGSHVNGDHQMLNVVPSQSGTYTFTSEDGCSETLDILITTVACQLGYIVPEYTIDGVVDSGSNSIEVTEGQDLILGITQDNVTFTISLPNGSQVNGDLQTLNVVPSQSGTYTFTSEDGCSETLDILINTIACQPGDIIPEYAIDGVVDSGSNSIELTEGQDLTMGITQENVTFTISLPNGSQVNGDHQMLNVVPSQSGTYTFTSEDGCSETLDIMINTIACQPGDIIPEYAIDGVVDSGSNSIELTEGQDLTMGITQENVTFTISLPNGSQVNGDHQMLNVVPSQSGTYTFTSSHGCTNILYVDIQIDTTKNNTECEPEDIIPEYKINGNWSSGSNILEVSHNTDLVLSMLPNEIGFTISRPDGSIATKDVVLGKVTSAQNGIYTITSEHGCETSISLIVEEEPVCPVGSIIPEYRLNNVWSSGNNNLNVQEGTEVLLSILPNNIVATVELPSGIVVRDNYNLGQVTAANEGLYILNSSTGCQTTINLTVTPLSNNAAKVANQKSRSSIENDKNTDSEVIEGLFATVHPNPSTGIVNVGLQDFENQQLTTLVFNSTGQLVFKKNFKQDHKSEEIIDLGELPSGIYRIVFQSGTLKRVNSVVIQR